MSKWLKPFVLVMAAGILAAFPAAAADDPIRTRVAAMKELSAHVKAIGGYLKGSKDPRKSAALGTAGDIELRAMAIASLADRLPSYFPKGTSSADMPGKTRARPEIWSMPDKFAAAAKGLGAGAKKLETAAASGDKARIAAVMKDFGKTACGGCHSTFRGPKPGKSM